MKKSLVLAMAMALGVTASAYAANPFSDVPAGHWAYDSYIKYYISYRSIWQCSNRIIRNIGNKRLRVIYRCY